MAARSVAELLPRPFDELDLDAVAEIVRRVGEDRESLYFERKRSVTPPSLAKTCAAFANTNGGLLIAGIEDESDEMVGVESIAEPQVWVKDVLRGRVLPLPAFRARTLDVGDDGSSLLLVLVEESSTTPHLLTRSGAIYVRNPGSSDPVPIADQARLLDLTRRGREARENATQRVLELLDHRWNEHELFTLVLAPTGVESDVVRALYRSGRAELLETATQIHDVSRDHRPEWSTLDPEWSLRRVRRQRQVRRHITEDPDYFLDGVVVTSEGVVQLQRCLVAREYGADPEPRGPRPVHLEEDRVGIVDWFAEALRRGRELILELGGHGDLAVAFRVRAARRNVFWAQSRAQEAKEDLLLVYWWDLDGERDEDLHETLRQDVRRSLGVRA